MAKRLTAKQQLAREEEQRRQEQLARDRKNQTIIGVIVVSVLVIALAVGGFFIWRATRPEATKTAAQAKAEVSAVETKPAAAGSEFGFLLSENGINSPVSGVPTVQVYLDFLCPACGTVDQALGSTWKQMVDAGQINLNVHPNAFLDAASSDQYSTRAAAAAVYIGQNEPEHLLDFIAAMFEADFQPAEGTSYKSVSDDEIVQQAIKAGVSEKVAKAAVGGDYTAWVTAVSQYTPLRPATQHKTGTYKGQMTTPTILINGNYWELSNITGTSDDLKAAFITAIGLTQDQVGKSSELPSIGGSKAPLSVS